MFGGIVGNLIGKVVPNYKAYSVKLRGLSRILDNLFDRVNRMTQAPHFYDLKSEVVGKLRNLRSTLPNRGHSTECLTIYDWADSLASIVESSKVERLSAACVVSSVLKSFSDLSSSITQQDSSLEVASELLALFGSRIKLAMSITAIDYIDAYVYQILELVLSKELFQETIKLLAECAVTTSGWTSLEDLRKHFERVERIRVEMKRLCSLDAQSSILFDDDKDGLGIGTMEVYQLSGTGLFLYHRNPQVLNPHFSRLCLWTPLGSLEVCEGIPAGNNAIDKLRMRFNLRDAIPEIPIPMWDDSDSLYALGCDDEGHSLGVPVQRTTDPMFQFIAETIWCSIRPKS